MTYIEDMDKSTKAGQVSVRFTPEGAAALQASVRRLGVTQTAVIEMAVREFAERRGYVAPARQPTQTKDTPGSYSPTDGQGEGG